MNRPSTSPRVALLGPLLGGHRGWVPSPGERLAGRLRDDGWQVSTASHRRRPLLRALEQVSAPSRWRGRLDVAVLLVFSGRGFRIAEWCAAACERVSVPVALWLHGGGLPDMARREPDRVRRLLGRGAAVVAPSAYLATTARELGFPANVIPNVLPIERLPFRPRAALTPRILWMRTFHEVYRPQLALEAFALLRRRRPEARLTMAGQDRGLQEAARRRAQESDLAGSVEFPGFLAGEAKLAALADHDLFLNTTRVDNAPVSLLEAAAAGIPIVASRVGGIPSLFDDEVSALLVEGDEPPPLAAALERLLGDSELATRLSLAGRRIAERCSWERVAPLWKDLLESLSAPPANR